MNEKDYKRFLDEHYEQFIGERQRLVRWLVISNTILLLLVIGIIAFGSYQLRYFKSLIDDQQYALSSKLDSIQDGRDGQDGVDGLSIVGPQGPSLQGPAGSPGTNGINGLNGTNGSSCTTRPVEGGAEINCPDGSTTFVSNGDQGAPGPAGKTVFIRTNPLTQQEECRYSGDTAWQPASECQ